MNVYKYLGRIASECFLRDLTIRFSQPKALNDPFELSPEFYGESCDLNGQTRFKTKYELSDGPSVFKDYILPIQKVYKERLMVDMKLQIEQLNSVLGVLCLTQDTHPLPRNSLMWAHYGESHSGIAIKFKSGCEFLADAHDVNYVKFRPVINAKVFHDHPIISIGDLFFKSDSWKYENEIRISKRLVDCINKNIKDSFGYDIYVYDISPEVLDCIYIGANASTSLKELALEFNMKTGIDVIYLAVGSSQYSLIPCSFNSRKGYGEMIGHILSIHKESQELL
jgi:hypothetical protein